MQNLIRELFSESVQQYPDRDALEISGQSFSYSYFNNLVQKIANAIIQQGIRGKAIVVLNEHTVYSYASLLAINFSGNTILPIEKAWPKQRIESILCQAKPAAFLKAEEELITSETLLTIDGKTGEAKNLSFSGKESRDYKDITYIIFTSGTTGVPKGVPVKQESINAFISFYKKEYDFTQTDRFLQVYELTFDVAYFSFLIPVCCGACCCVLNAKKGVPKYLFIIDDLIRRNITVVSMVPTVLHFIKKYLKAMQAPAVRYSFFSGDALYHSEAVKWQQFVPNAAIHNFYGPTETTIVCTKYVWNQEIAGKESVHDIVPLGKPFPDMKFTIVDEHNVTLAEGERGELCFSGVQVIDSYLNHSNEEKFFEIIEGDQKSRYYKTGDLASVNKNGHLIFHGRADLQVKINGYRIELQEVEQALQKVVNRKCIVVKKRNDSNADYLKAYIEGEKQKLQDIKTALLQLLPDYMIPAQFEFIQQIPVSENGKIDKLYLQSI